MIALRLGLVVVLLVGNATIARAAPQVRLGGLREAQGDGVRQAILLGVQQGIASLPPASGQALVYTFDYDAEVFTSNFVLGPSAFRSPEVVGKGSFNVRATTSYFRVEQELDPIDYSFQPEPGPDCSTEACLRLDYSRFGASFRADVGLLNLTTAYGVTRWLETRLTFPVVFVDAKASGIFPVLRVDADKPPMEVDPAFRQSPESLDEGMAPGGGIVTRKERFSHLGVGSFSEGSNAGLGRIDLGTKAAILHLREGTEPEGLAFRQLDIALENELFFPSPNEEEFAGPESFAILPRLIGTIGITDWLRLHFDGGYEYDFDEAALRRFAWSAGLSACSSRFSVDAGLGGSEFQKGVEWTPDSVQAFDAERGVNGDLRKVPDEDNELDSRFFDVLLGVKGRIVDQLVVGGTLNVPVLGTGFRPDVIWTFGVEYTY